MFHASDGAPEVVIWATIRLWGCIQHVIQETVVGEEEQGLMSVVWPFHHFFFFCVSPRLPLTSWALITQSQPNRHFMCNSLVYWGTRLFSFKPILFMVYVLMIIASASLFEHIKKKTEYWYFHTHFLTQNLWIYTHALAHTCTHRYIYISWLRTSLHTIFENCGGGKFPVNDLHLYFSM